jgi:hypothetical protein
VIEEKNMKTGWSLGAPWLPKLSVFLLLISAVFVSCYPGDITDVAELDTVATLYDDTFPFSQQSTYSMPDSVFHLCDVAENPPSDCIKLSRANDTFILNTVRAQMQTYGWELLPGDDSQGIPDVRVVVMALGSESTSWYAWNPWNPWYPGGGWYYPPVWQPVTTQKGTLALNMAIADSVVTVPGSGSGPPIVWGGVLNGALGTGSSASTRSRLENGIIQAYRQSPYLNVAGSTP